MADVSWRRLDGDGLLQRMTQGSTMRHGQLLQVCQSALAALSLLVAGTSGVSAAGKVERGLEIASPTLGRPIAYSIYVPDSASQAGRRFPVMYLFHGRGDTETAWLDNGAIAATLDRKIAAGELQPLIVVMPMAGDSWYVDDARPNGHGRMAQAFTGDLIAGIDAKYPTAPCAAARAAGGLSMGGFGAMVYALTKPQLFTAAISLSGSLFTDKPEEIKLRLARTGQMFDGVYGEPFDPERFRAWTVFQRLANAPQDAARLKYWLAAGDKDFSGILSGTVRLHQELLARGMSSELRIYSGAHTWSLWAAAIDPALSWLSPQLNPGCAKP
jgi:S-formylglutathione hydrolase FrmB